MWYLAVVGLIGAVAPAVEVRTITDESVTGAPVELNSDHVIVEASNGRRRLDLSQVTGIWWKDQPGAPKAPGPLLVELADGSLLAAKGFVADSAKAQVALAEGRPIEVAVQLVRRVRFTLPSEGLAGQWEQIAGTESPADLLVVSRSGSLDYYKGVIHRVAEEAVEFELDGERLRVKRDRVFGLVYHRPSGPPPTKPIGRLLDTSGSSWAVRSVRLSGDQVECTTPIGLTLQRPLRSLVRLDLSRGKVVYLSDLQAESIEWVPYLRFGVALPSLRAMCTPKPDRSLDSGPLQLDGQRYAKGLAICSRTTLVYRLPERFRRFSAVVGIDDQVRPHGNVRLVIRGDDRVLLETTVAGSDPARPIELDLTGVRRLAILVDFGEDMDVGDWLDLGNARLSK